MKLSVVIVNWNTREDILRCLDSLTADLSRFGSQLAQIIVIDNASTDGSAQAISAGYPSVHLIQNQRNVGFAAANNQGLQISDGEFILLLNPDTVIRPGALAVLVDFMNGQRQAGAAGPRLLNQDGTLQISGYPRPTLFREWWRLFHADRLLPLSNYPAAQWQREEPVQVDVLKGACLLLRREALDEVGLLNEQYFMYTEEVDLCRRIQEAGWQLFWVPDAEVVHYGGQSTRQAAREMFLELYRSKLLYFRLHNGAAGAVAYKGLLIGASLARLAMVPAALFEPRARREQHLNLARHYLHLLAALPSL